MALIRKWSGTRVALTSLPQEIVQAPCFEGADCQLEEAIRSKRSVFPAWYRIELTNGNRYYFTDKDSPGRFLQTHERPEWEPRGAAQKFLPGQVNALDMPVAGELLPAAAGLLGAKQVETTPVTTETVPAETSTTPQDTTQTAAAPEPHVNENDQTHDDPFGDEPHPSPAVEYEGKKSKSKKVKPVDGEF